MLALAGDNAALKARFETDHSPAVEIENQVNGNVRDRSQKGWIDSMVHSVPRIQRISQKRTGLLRWKVLAITLRK